MMDKPTSDTRPVKGTGVTREDVLWCYQRLLGREPESEAVIASHMSSHDVRSLYRNFAESDEFALRRRAEQSGMCLHPTLLPALSVEARASPRQLADGIAKVRATWNALGAVKPHFSVLTDQRFLPSCFAKYSEAFWQSGDEEAAMVREWATRYGVSNAEDQTVLELGCGVGRVSVALAKRFGRVLAYDISSEHLKLAKARAADVDVDNIEFLEFNDVLSTALPQHDIFYSRIVLQHNPPPVIAELIRASLGGLKPGGVSIFQVPVYRVGYRFGLTEWLDKDAATDMEMHCLPQSVVFELISEAKCVAVEVREENSTGAPESFISNMFVVRRPR